MTTDPPLLSSPPPPSTTPHGPPPSITRGAWPGGGGGEGGGGGVTTKVYSFTRKRCRTDGCKKLQPIKVFSFFLVFYFKALEGGFDVSPQIANCCKFYVPSPAPPRSQRYSTVGCFDLPTLCPDASAATDLYPDPPVFSSCTPGNV